MIVDICKASSWPPGSMMLFRSPHHEGLGLVVANVDSRIVVMWDMGCKEKICEYPVSQLNPLVISRFL